MHWIFGLAIAFTGVVVYGGKSLGAVAVLRLVELLAADYFFRAPCPSRLLELLLYVSSYLLFIDHIFQIVRTNFDLNLEQEWTQAQKARTINL